MPNEDIILYDDTGVRIPPAGSLPPPSGVSVIPGGVDSEANDRYRQYVSKGLTPAKLARILEEADSGWPYDLFQLCEEIMEKDPKISSLFQTRTLAIQGLTREVLPPELDDALEADRAQAEEIARFCQRALESTNIDELLGDIMDAIAKPFSVDWIHWGTNADGKIIPLQFQHIPGTHLMWAVKKNELRIYDPLKPMYNSGEGEVGEILPVNSTVRAISNPRKDIAVRAGLMRTLSWYYMFKIIALKDYASWLDRYGMPLRVAKVNATQFNDEAFYTKIRSSLRTLGSDGSGVFTSDTEIEIIAAAKQGAEGFDRMIDIVNREASQLVLGHELSSQSSPGSGQLGISAAIAVRQDYVEGDCNWLGAIVRRDVFRPMVEWNFGPDAVQKGLVPFLWLDYEPSKDLIAEANMRKIIAETFPDLEFSEQDTRDTFGIARPIGEEEPEDDVLNSKKPAPNPFGAPPVPGEEEEEEEEEEQPKQPPEQVQRAFVLKTKKPRKRYVPTKFSRARQKRIDRYATQQIKDAQLEEQKIQQQLVGILRSVLADGGSYADARSRVIKSYPDLSVKRIEELLNNGLELTRTAGRNGG